MKTNYIRKYLFIKIAETHRAEEFQSALGCQDVQGLV